MFVSDGAGANRVVSSVKFRERHRPIGSLAAGEFRFALLGERGTLRHDLIRQTERARTLRLYILCQCDQLHGLGGADPPRHRIHQGEIRNEAHSCKGGVTFGVVLLELPTPTATDVRCRALERQN